MAATLIMGSIFFALAIFGLSIGIIFKKRTPLKGECHAPVDGGGSCATCGGGHDSLCDSTEGTASPNKKRALIQGDFTIQNASDKISLLK